MKESTMRLLLAIVLVIQVTGSMVVRDDSVGQRLMPDDISGIAQIVGRDEYRGSGRLMTPGGHGRGAGGA
jgi:hypothetical protein